MNRTCPEVVCAIIYLHRGEPFLKRLEFKTCGWQNDRHFENFHCRVWARIMILVSSYKSDDHMSPLEGQVHHIDFMFIHLSCMHQNEKWVPSESATPNFERKTWEIKNVLVAALIFEKSWNLWTKAWLASSLLEQTLKKTSGEGPSNRSTILVQPPTMTQPKETGGQTWSKASTQSKGELHRRMEPVLVLKKLPLLDHACKNFLIFSTYSSFCRLFGSKFHKIFLVQWAFLVNKIMWFLFLCSFK